MAPPSIKGSVFGTAAGALNKALADGQVTRAQLEAALSADEIEVLESAILASLWYDIGTFGRICNLLRDTVGEGDDAYLSEAGRASARALRDSGVSAQLDFLVRAQQATSQVDTTRSTQAEMGLALFNTIYNFGSWRSVPDPDHDDRYMIEIGGAEAFPDASAWRTAGFLNEMAAWRGWTEDLWYWERPERDIVRLRMRINPSRAAGSGGG